MAGDKKQRRKVHLCPPLPSDFVKFETPRLDPGDGVNRAKAKWAAYLRKVQNLRPTPRQTR